MQTILLLVIANVFMTFAWYGHLQYKSFSLWKVVLVSWLIALLEYCFQVPANRLGYGQCTAAQLKIIQEVITLVIFCIFSVLYLKEELKWNYLVGFLLMIGAVFLMSKSGKRQSILIINSITCGQAFRLPTEDRRRKTWTQLRLALSPCLL